MYKNFIFLPSFIILLALSGCQPEQKISEPPPQSSDTTNVSEVAETKTEQYGLSSVITASRVYALDMFKQLNTYNNAAETPEKNLIISPLSIEYMMAMLKTGADQQSNDAISKALHLSGVDTAALNQVFSQNIIAHKQRSNEDNQLLIANGIFINKDLAINTSFQKQMENLFDAKIQSVDVNNDESLINKWVSEATKERISHIVENPLADTTLVNAVYFKGKWPDQYFEKANTTERMFKGMTEEKLIPTMTQSELAHYYEDEHLQAYYQPYKSSDYGMLIFLPKGETAADLDKILMQLDEPYFTKIIDSTKSTQTGYSGTLYLPKFTAEYKNNQLLENSLQFLGVDLQKTLFPNIVKQHNLAITKMLHVANISVSEEGTEAAAATVTEMTTTAAAPKTGTSFVMDVNHPFAYAIVDREGYIIFMGTIRDI